MAKRLTNPILIVFTVLIIIYFNLFIGVPNRDLNQLLPPSASIRYFTFGYDETIGDSLWLRAIQNFRSCEQVRGASSFASNGARMGLDRTSSCQRGWLFHMLSVILDIIPRFQYAARIGPVVLSVIVDDVEGATILFEKAMRNYPDDWVIMTRAAYHYVFEVEDQRRGAALYYRAAQLGAPAWMALYASKLSDKNGRRAMARSMILNFMKENVLKASERKLFEDKLKALEDQ